MTMKNFVNGEILTESDVDIYLVNTIVAIKSTGESVTSSTTLQNDDELFIPLAANSTYWVYGMLITDGAAAGDFKSTLTVPSGADIFVEWLGPSVGATSGADLYHYLQEASAGSQNWGTIAAFDHRAVSFWGIVTIAGTAGNLQLQWAQVASNATATRVLGNSTIWARRIS